MDLTLSFSLQHQIGVAVLDQSVRLAATTASIAERKLLAQEWKDAQRKKAPPALFVKRPMPDAVVAVRPK